MDTKKRSLKDEIVLENEVPVRERIVLGNTWPLNGAYRPAISVILPIYNIEKDIKECLESIQNQSFQDFEVLMIDDGSTDSSGKVCTRFLSDERFHYFKQENSGVSVARNLGIKKANGEWLAFVDPDDKIDSEYLNTLYSLCRYDADIVCCCCCTFDVNGEKKTCSFYDEDCVFCDVGTVVPGIEKSDYKRRSKRELLLELLDGNYGASKRETAIGVPWGKLYRASFINDNNIRFNKELIRMQDNVFNMYAFDMANFVIYVNKPLYNYRIENIKSYGTKFDRRAKEYYILVSKYRREYLEENKLMDDDEIRSAYLNELAHMVMLTMRSYFLNAKSNMSIRKTAKDLKSYLEGSECIFLLKNVNEFKCKSKMTKTLLIVFKMKLYFFAVAASRIGFVQKMIMKRHKVY